MHRHSPAICGCPGKPCRNIDHLSHHSLSSSHAEPTSIHPFFSNILYSHADTGLHLNHNNGSLLLHQCLPHHHVQPNLVIQLSYCILTTPNPLLSPAALSVSGAWPFTTCVPAWWRLCRGGTSCATWAGCPSTSSRASRSSHCRSMPHWVMPWGWDPSVLPWRTSVSR